MQERAGRSVIDVAIEKLECCPSLRKAGCEDVAPHCRYMAAYTREERVLPPLELNVDWSCGSLRAHTTPLSARFLPRTRDRQSYSQCGYRCSSSTEMKATSASTDACCARKLYRTRVLEPRPVSEGTSRD